LTKEGKGGGYARNIGLQYAKGTWVIFSDADDFFTSDFQQALDEITDDSPDITFFNATSIRIDDASRSHRVDHLNQMHVLYDTNPKKASLQFRFLFGEPWCKIIRRELISSRQICFDEIPIHNDTLFSYMVGYYAKSIGVNHLIVYCVTDSPGTVSKNQAKEVHYIRTTVFAKKNRFLYEHKIPLFDNLLLVSIADCATNKEWDNLIKCLFVARRNGFPVLGLLIRALAPNRLKPIVGFGMAKRYKYSYNV
jgi:glycosyltransferase involved in cell wall biosynthesis